ncbi:MAG: regulatory subunit-like protein [Deltaproteobacteria bacterium]|jgi:CRP-like cAMP-binding protein|nr:regulatory subunit-like protein [Deltaproteobacteria bacterium]
MPGFLEGLFAGSKQEKDVRELQQKILQNRKNHHLLVKLGDLLERKGRRADALEAYREASERFSRSGFLIQAIAVNKVILRLDPSQSQIQERLASLYAERGISAWEGAGSEANPVLPFIPLFSDLKKDEFLRLMQKIQTRQFHRGEFPCRQGDRGESLFVISRGKVTVFREEAGREKIFLNTLQEGDFFGEFGFFSQTPRTATVEALEEADILEISKSDLDEVIREFPGVSRVLWNFYKERVADTLIATSVLFRSFPPPERKRLLQMLIPQEIAAGALVLEEGEPGDSLFLIKKGEAEVFTRDVQGEILPLAFLREGDFFGEISLITGRPRTASVKARQALELLRLQKEDFNELLKTHPEILTILEESLRYRFGNKLKALGVFRESSQKERIL